MADEVLPHPTGPTADVVEGEEVVASAALIDSETLVDDETIADEADNESDLRDSED